MTPQISSFWGPQSRSGLVAVGVVGGVLLLALGWVAIVWSRPAPIRIAFASSLTGSSGPAGQEKPGRDKDCHRRSERKGRDQGSAPRTRQRRDSGGRRMSAKSTSTWGSSGEESGLQTRTIEVGPIGNLILNAVKSLVENLPPMTTRFL